MRQLNGGRIVEGSRDERNMLMTQHMIWTSPQYPTVWHEPEQWNFQVGSSHVVIHLNQVEDGQRRILYYVDRHDVGIRPSRTIRIKNSVYNEEDLKAVLEEVLTVVDINAIMES